MFRTRRKPTNEGRTNPRRSRTGQVSQAYSDMVQQLTPEQRELYRAVQMTRIMTRRSRNNRRQQSIFPNWLLLQNESGKAIWHVLLPTMGSGKRFVWQERVRSEDCPIEQVLACRRASCTASVGDHDHKAKCDRSRYGCCGSLMGLLGGRPRRGGKLSKLYFLILRWLL